MRAVVIDDHALIRDSLRHVLLEELDADEVIEAETLDQGLEDLAAAEGTVDLIIVDLNMPGESGPESVGALVEAFPAAKVVVVSASEAKDDVMGCLAAGVDGYIPKTLSVAEMVAALRQVLDGAMFVPRALTRRGVEPPRPRARLHMPGVDNLTARQREVLDELLLGRSSKEIARTLAVAEGTVKIHLAAIYRALGVRSRAEAISRLMVSRV
ncbi:response regulator [Phenylobacterium sp.]|jgi:DNA-binding NarL/FixJ family response regulator|uniref:response regulator n=1 Tax=Phenylobacterium sp. TaxID=1871053 RepID=UPI003782EE86